MNTNYVASQANNGQSYFATLHGNENFENRCSASYGSKPICMCQASVQIKYLNILML